MKKLTDEEQQALRRAVNNFNAKVKRLEKQGNTLTEKVKIKEIKQEINTKADLKRQLNILHRFSKRGIEEESEIKGISKYELKEAKINIRIEKARITRERKKLLSTPFSAGGVPTGYSIGNIKPTEISELNADYERLNQLLKTGEPYDIRQKINKLKYGVKVSSRYKQSLNFKENYLYAFTESYKNYDGFEELYSKIKSLDVNTFYNIIRRDDLLLDFINFYENDMYKGDAIFKRFNDIWNMNLNDFKK